MNKLEVFKAKHKSAVNTIKDSMYKGMYLVDMLTTITYVLIGIASVMIILVLSAENTLLFSSELKWIISISMSLSTGIIVLGIYIVKVIVLQLNGIIMIQALVEDNDEVKSHV